MKKGLRHLNTASAKSRSLRRNHWPDEEGIATPLSPTELWLLITLRRNHWPDEEGIATGWRLPFTQFWLWPVGITDLMKKGLRHAPLRPQYPGNLVRRNHWPDEEGIATQLSVGCYKLWRIWVGITDLMKKGLRPGGKVLLFIWKFCRNHWPDEEGIATCGSAQPY